MTTRYAHHVSTRRTPQSEPVPGSQLVRNGAGGYAFPVDDWVRLDRFLILGAEGGCYYAGERALSLENAAAVRRCLEADGPRTVARVAGLSESGRAPKNDPAVFALAMAAGMGRADTRAAALAALPRVCRTGTHLFQFADAVAAFRGWGRALRRAVGAWYAGRDPRDLAYQLAKYQRRGGWSHRDLLRLCHVKLDGPANAAARWAVGKPDALPADAAGPASALAPLAGCEAVRRATTAAEVVRLVREYRLVRECVPTRWLREPAVWEALLADMPLAALVRNLAAMTRVGLLTPASDATYAVLGALGDADRLRRSRLHPVAVLAALLTYSAGRGARRNPPPVPQFPFAPWVTPFSTEARVQRWSPVPRVVDALDAAFYTTFTNAEPTGRRWLLALDVSGSMGCYSVAGVPGLTPRVASAAVALVTAATEPHHHVVGFTGGPAGVARVPISPRRRLDDALGVVSALPMGPTDCALPVLYALERGLAVDVFVVYTDSETWYGGVHPAQRCGSTASGPASRRSWWWSGWCRTGSASPTRTTPGCSTWSGSTRRCRSSWQGSRRAAGRAAGRAGARRRQRSARRTVPCLKTGFEVGRIPAVVPRGRHPAHPLRPRVVPAGMARHAWERPRRGIGCGPVLVLRGPPRPLARPVRLDPEYDHGLGPYFACGPCASRPLAVTAADPGPHPDPSADASPGG